MALSNVTDKARYTGNGTTTDFAIPHGIIASDSSEVEVYLVDESVDPAVETLKTETTHYTLTGASLPSIPFDTTVSFITAPTSGLIVHIRRAIALTQPTDFTTNGAYPAETAETAYDRIVAQVQYLQEQINRAALLRKSTSVASVPMTDPVASSYLRWNAAATGIESGSTVAAGTISVPASSTDNAIARWDSTGGNSIQNSVITIDDTGIFGGTPPTIYSVYQAKTAQTATYAVLTTDTVIYMSGSAFTATLPTAVGVTGKKYVFIKTDANFNVFTIATTSSQTINGVTTTTLNTQYESVTVISDGANWMLQRFIPSKWTAYTPTSTAWPTASSNVTYTGMWQRTGDKITCHIYAVFTGAPAAGQADVSFPAGLTLDTAKLLGYPVTGLQLGDGTIRDEGTETFPCGVYYYTTALVRMFAYGAGAVYGNVVGVTETVPMTWANTDKYSVTFSAPITGWNG